MTLIDVILDYHRKLSEKPLNASARSLLFAIICEWNGRSRPRSITVSTSRLKEIAGIKSKDTYYRALKNLSSRQLIKYDLNFPFIDVQLICDCESKTVKSELLLSIPKTETEGVRKAEIFKPNPNSKYAGLTVAEMLAKRRAERESIRDTDTGSDRDGKKVTFSADVEGRASDT